MKYMNEIVNELVDEIETVEDIPVAYEVWAIGYDEADELTGASLVLATFNDPDEAVEYAKALTLADVVNLAAEDDYGDLTYETHSISIEVETVVPSADEEELNMNVGTVFKKRIEIYEELPEFVELTSVNYEILEDGSIKIPCFLLKDYNKNDEILVIFKDDTYEVHPIPYKIISKTTDDFYICEFV